MSKFTSESKTHLGGWQRPVFATLAGLSDAHVRITIEDTNISMLPQHYHTPYSLITVQVLSLITSLTVYKKTFTNELRTKWFCEELAMHTARPRGGRPTNGAVKVSAGRVY
jgi:hypothetical protein